MSLQERGKCVYHVKKVLTESTHMSKLELPDIVIKDP